MPKCEVHATAIVEAGARLGDGVRIGPFCHVGKDAVLGDSVELVSHAVVAGRTTIGARTRTFPFASIGHQPQDLMHHGEPSTLEVGSDCLIREGVTMNPGTEGGGMATVVGDSCAFLANSHVGHDCKVGSNVIFSNNVMLAGHCAIGDYVILGGGAAVIQFARVGAHAFVGGMSGLENDLIPYGMALGNRAHLSGLNIIGLQRRGFSREDSTRSTRLPTAVRRRGHPGGAPRRRGEGVRPSHRQGDRRLHPRRRQALPVRPPRRRVTLLSLAPRNSARLSAECGLPRLRLPLHRRHRLRCEEGRTQRHGFSSPIAALNSATDRRAKCDGVPR